MMLVCSLHVLQAKEGVLRSALKSSNFRRQNLLAPGHQGRTDHNFQEGGSKRSCFSSPL